MSMELETMELVRYKYSCHVCSTMLPFFFELAFVWFPYFFVYFSVVKCVLLVHSWSFFFFSRYHLISRFWFVLCPKTGVAARDVHKETYDGSGKDDDRGGVSRSFDEMVTIDLVETTLTIRLQTCTTLRLSNR